MSPTMSPAMILPPIAAISAWHLIMLPVSILLFLAVIAGIVALIRLIAGQRPENASRLLQSPHQIVALVWACLVGGLVLSTLLGYWHGMAICIALIVAFKLALRGGLLRESPAEPGAAPPVIRHGAQSPSVPGSCPQCGTTLPGGAPQGLCPACLLKQGVATEAGAVAGERVTFAPPPPAVLAKSFPQLEILEFIGQGGMGAVYKARQPTLDRQVALKILPPQAGRDPGFAERFSREARALARLNHPNIVGIYDFGQTGEYYYFVMEHVDGTNLRQLERTRKLAPREALAIVPQICDALQYAHDEGVVHRDIKPENILVDRRGRVKIADFGLAKLLGQERKDVTITESNHVIGTPHYMAPEQVEHPQHVDHRADIYSLGVVFYEMLTGELPIGRFAAPSQKVHVDVRLDEVVLRALEKEPERRYQQASVLKTEVQTIATTPPPVIGPPTGEAKREPPKAGTPPDDAVGPGVAPAAQSSAGLRHDEVASAAQAGVSPVSPPPPPVQTIAPHSPHPGGGAWKIVAAVLLILAIPVGLVLLAIGLHIVTKHRSQPLAVRKVEKPPALTFGPVIERELPDEQANPPTRHLINLKTGEVLSSPTNLDAAADEAGFTNWADQAGADAAVEVQPGDKRRLVALRQCRFAWISANAWTELTADTLETMWPKRFNDPETRLFGAQLLPEAFMFKTREGTLGLGQITGFTDNPPGVKIRYKLVQTPGTGSIAGKNGDSRGSDAFSTRLEAAAGISNPMDRDDALSALAKDAARAGDVAIVKASLGGMTNVMDRDDAAHAVARLLAKRRLHSDAVEVAKSMSNLTERDETLKELSR